MKGTNKLLDHSVRELMERRIQTADPEELLLLRSRQLPDKSYGTYEAAGLCPTPVATQATCPQHNLMFRPQDPGLNLT